MGKRSGELNQQNCEAPRSWQVAPWLTHRLVQRTHTLLVFFIHFPLSFSFRQRPNRAQQVNVKKRERTPLRSAFQGRTKGRPTSCTAALKPWLKLFLLAIDWGCKAKTNKTPPHCRGLIMTGPHLQSTCFKWLVGFCFLRRCVSVWVCVFVSLCVCVCVCVLQKERGRTDRS